jgi:hypothetical protein
MFLRLALLQLKQIPNFEVRAVVRFGQIALNDDSEEHRDRSRIMHTDENYGIGEGLIWELLNCNISHPF